MLDSYAQAGSGGKRSLSWKTSDHRGLKVDGADAIAALHIATALSMMMQIVTCNLITDEDKQNVDAAVKQKSIYDIDFIESQAHQSQYRTISECYDEDQDEVKKEKILTQIPSDDKEDKQHAAAEIIRIR